MPVSGADVAAYAQGFAGKVRYRWAGYLPATGWDCSGMVGYVLGEHFGMVLPGGFHWSGKIHPPVAASYKVWSKASTVANAEAGDLCCWVTHIGIALDNERMVSALGAQFGTVVSQFRQSGPPGEPLSIRRVNTVGATPMQATTLASGCLLGLIGFPYYAARGLICRPK